MRNISQLMSVVQNNQLHCLIFQINKKCVLKWLNMKSYIGEKCRPYLENEQLLQEKKLLWRLACYWTCILDISRCYVFFYRVNKILIYTCCNLRSRSWAFLAYHKYLNIRPVQLSKIKEICWKAIEIFGKSLENEIEKYIFQCKVQETLST